jgi:hypothetical protein
MAAKAQDMKTLFSNMPDSCLPQLEMAWRKDLIELYLSGREARLINTMNGHSALLQLTDDYLLLRLTERSLVEMKKLPLINNTSIICMVITVEGPAPDSRLSFFTTDWHPLESSGLFTPPSLDSFINPEADRDADAFHNAISRLDIRLVKYELSPDALTLTAICTTPLYLAEEERIKILPFLTPQVYTWNKLYFRHE